MKTVQMHGVFRFYFPELPSDHPLNGMFAHGRQESRGKAEDGRPQMGLILGFYKGQDIRIRIADVDSAKERILVKQWYSPEYNQQPEYFYLVK